MLKKIVLIFLIIYSLTLTVILIYLHLPKDKKLPSIIFEKQTKQLPLIKYSLENLKTYNYQTSSIELIGEVEKTDNYISSQFSFETMNKKMSGLINLPARPDNMYPEPKSYPVVIMIRGWAPLENYSSGTGSSNSGKTLATNGYITFAPDFFGYGKSDAELADSWEARFTKPINIIELIKTIKNTEYIKIDGKQYYLDSDHLGIWAHSNGGQIALSVLEITGESIPTVLWAPVTAPFPYSIIFFSDENDDEGKAMRKWLAMFEEDYDVFDFSITKHLESLAGPIQIHHGTSDEAALISWSDEFTSKLKQENLRRIELKDKILDSSISATDKTTAIEKQNLEPIDYEYFRYPGADHNLVPHWQTVIDRSLEFFNTKLH